MAIHQHVSQHERKHAPIKAELTQVRELALPCPCCGGSSTWCASLTCRKHLPTFLPAIPAVFSRGALRSSASVSLAIAGRKPCQEGIRSQQEPGRP